MNLKSRSLVGAALIAAGGLFSVPASADVTFATISGAESDLVKQTLSVVLSGSSTPLKVSFFSTDAADLVATSMKTGASSVVSPYYDSHSFSSTNSFSYLTGPLAAGTYTFKLLANWDVYSVGGRYTFTISAVPEPAEWALLGAGLVCLVGFARRKQAAAEALTMAQA